MLSTEHDTLIVSRAREGRYEREELMKLGTALLGGRRSAALAAVLFLVIFVLRLTVAGSDAAILLLCVIPTALIAAEFRLRDELAAAVLSGAWSRV